MKKSVVLFIATVLATLSFTNVTTTSGTTDPTPVPTATGLTFGSFSETGFTGANSVANGRFGFAGMTDTSLNVTKYFTVTLTPTGSDPLDLDTISLSFTSTGLGPKNLAVQSSLDGFSSNIFSTTSSIQGTTATDLITLSSAFDALTAPVTFRIYAWGASGAPGNLSLNNVTFSGTVPTPEPSTVALTTLGGIACFFIARRKH